MAVLALSVHCGAIFVSGHFVHLDAGCKLLAAPEGPPKGNFVYFVASLSFASISTCQVSANYSMLALQPSRLKGGALFT